MGRSPAFATVSRTVRRPAFASMSPSPRMYSPGIISGPSSDGMVDRDQLRAVGEGALDLHLLEHLRHAVHDVVPLQNGDAKGHEVGNAPPVAGAFEHLGGDECESLRVVQLEAA